MAAELDARILARLRRSCGSNRGYLPVGIDGAPGRLTLAVWLVPVAVAALTIALVRAALAR